MEQEQGIHQRNTESRGARMNPLFIVIVSTNDARWLGPCLASLQESHYNNFRLAIVANQCIDNTEQIAKSAKMAVDVLSTDRRLPFADANNLAFADAHERGFRYVLLLNPDTKVHPNALSVLIDFMDSHADYGIAGCWQAAYGDDTWSIPNQWSKDTIGEAENLGNTPKSVGNFTVLDHYYVQGAALMLRASLIQKVGLLDRIYGTFYEETDLCRRVRLLGLNVALIFNSRVQHAGGGNWKHSKDNHLERDHLFLRNQFLYELSDPFRRKNLLWVAMQVVRNQLRSLCRNEQDLILSVWRYPAILVSVSRRARYLRAMHARNHCIISGLDIDVRYRSIGPPIDDR